MTPAKRHELSGLLLVVCGLPSMGALAHHGQVSNGALYLTDDFIELDGEVTDVFWRNPHTRAKMSVVDDSGEEIVWELELGPNPHRFEGRDIFADDLLGRVSVAGYRSKRDPSSLGVLHFLLPDGREWVQGNRELLWSNRQLEDPAEQELDPAKVAAAERTADGIFRVWSWVRGRSGERDLESLLTSHGRDVAAGFDAAADTPELDCKQGMPTTMLESEPMQIIGEPDRIIIRRSKYDIERIVYLNNHSDVQPQASPLGHSIGRWERNVLVVETTHIDWPYTGLRGSGLPQSNQASYRETFSLSDEEDGVLNYEIMITDSVMFTEPFTQGKSWQWIPGVEIEPYDCVAEWNESTQ